MKNKVKNSRKKTIWNFQYQMINTSKFKVLLREVKKSKESLKETIDCVDNTELAQFAAKTKELQDLWKLIVSAVYSQGGCLPGERKEKQRKKNNKTVRRTERKQNGL